MSGIVSCNASEPCHALGHDDRNTALIIGTNSIVPNLGPKLVNREPVRVYNTQTKSGTNSDITYNPCTV